METASQIKRGRPAKFLSDFYYIYSNTEKRTAQNQYYAGIVVDLLGQKPGDFFVTEKGNFRRQTIAERIGRALNSGVITDIEAQAIVQAAVNGYKNGVSVKELVGRINTAIYEISKGA